MPKPKTVDRNRAEGNLWKIMPLKWRHCAIAIPAVAIALLAMLKLDPLAAMSKTPFLLFFGAVMVSAWYGGFWSGLLATVLSALLSNYFFVEPTYTLAIDLDDVVRVCLFVLQGILFSVLCEALHAAKRRAETNFVKLQAKEEQYRRIVETTNEAIWVVDAEWQTTYVNDRMAQMFGYSVEEMLDRPIFDFMDNLARTEAQQQIEQRQQGIKDQFEFRYRRKDGSDIWALVSSTPIMDDRGRFMGSLAMIIDVTNRKKAEEELQESETRFRQLAENIREVFWISNPTNGEILYISPAYEEIWGRTCSSLYEQPNSFLESIHLEDRDRAIAAIEVQRRGDNSETEYRIARPDGHERWIRDRAFPIKNKLGQVYRVAGIAEDITDRKLSEEALRCSERELTDFFENGAIGLQWVGPDGCVLRANQAALDIVGYAREEYVGHPLSNFYADPEAIADIFQRLTRGKRLHNYETQLKCKDGSIKQVLIESNVLWGEDDQFIHTRCFIRDISDRKQLEEALQKSEKRYRTFIEQSSEGIWRFELDPPISRHCSEEEQIQHFYKYAYMAECNEVTAQMYGFSSALEMVGLKLEQFLVSSDPNNLEYLLNFIRSGYRLVDAESHEIDRYGNSKYFLNNLVGTFEDGLLVRAWGTQRDITELKKLEENLQESERRFRIMADTAPVLIWMSGIDKLCDYFNKSWLEFTGRTLEQEQGNGWAEGVHPDDFQRRLDIYSTSFDAREKFQMEYRLRRFDGEYRWILDTGVPRFTPDGSFIGYIGSCIDINDRKLAEETLRESEEQIRLITDSVPTLIAYIDAKERYIFNNKAYERWFGYDRSEIAGKTLKEFLGEVAYQQVKNQVKAVLSGQKIRYETAIDYREIGPKYIEANYVPHWGESGEVKGYVALINDISDRKKIEEEIVKLNQSLQRRVAELQTLLEVIPIGIAIAEDSASQKISVNPAFAKLLGIPPTANASLSAPIEERPSHLKVYKNGRELSPEEQPVQICAARSVEILNEEIDIVPEEGKKIKLLASAAPLFDEKGNSRGCVATFLDITERKRTEEAQRFLAEASAVLASSLDYITILSSVAQLAVPHIADWCTVHTIEEDGSVQQLAVAHVNPAKVKWAHELQRKYPYDPNQSQGLPQVLRSGSSEIYPDIPDELLVASARDPEHLEIMREIGFSSVIMVPMVARDRILGAISFIAAESGRHYDRADLILAEDLASRVALAVDNARLYSMAQRDRAVSEAARKEAEAANRIKDEFLATLSHELRTPLTAILGWSRLLRSQTLDETGKERALETIERNAKSQSQLIDDILDVSRIITGKLRLDVRPVDLVLVIQAGLDSVRPAAEAKSISIQSALDPSVGPVSGDPERLQQVVWNLLSNAIKFTPKGGYVQIRLERINSHVAIIVSDTGKGIAPEFLPYVFDRFRQAEGGSTRTHGGLGLGLAIVRHLVELHGGTVRVASPGDGQGSTFTVKLPVLSVKNKKFPPSPPLPHSPSSPLLLSGVRVLVVEDEPDARDLIAIALESYGAQVTAVTSATEAIEAIANSKPDVLISDIEMPYEDGYTLIRKIRALDAANGGDIPATALTAYARGDDRKRALSAGFQMHVAKPVDPAELAEVVATLAGRTGHVGA